MFERVRRFALPSLLVLVVLAWGASEIRWHRINNPDGKFSTASEYLAHDRLPSRVETVQVDGKPYVIAMGPMDSLLAIPSGLPAYVFDNQGKLVDWTLDSGDADDFLQRWRYGVWRRGELTDIEALAHP